MIANVEFEDLGLSIQVHPLASRSVEYYDAIGKEAQKLGMDIVLGKVDHPTAIAAAGRVVASTLMESASVDRTPEQWGDWFSAHPEEFYQLMAVVENPDLWREWREDGA